MGSEKHSGSKGLFTRREFLSKSAGAGIAAAVSATFPALTERTSAARQERNYILIGHPNPSTGALSEFGEVSPWADERAIAAANSTGGIFIKEFGKKIPVKVKVVDTQSDPVKAGKVATEMIGKDHVDMIVVMHTPDTVNPVSKVCENHGVPCVSAVVPLEAWLSDGPYNWCYHAFWGLNSLTELFLGMCDEHSDKTTKVFGGLWPDDPDGKAFAEVFTKKLTARGYRVTDPGRFPFWSPDFTDIISLFMREKVEIVGGVVIPSDWANFWRQAHQDGFVPKMAMISKAVLFPTAVDALPGNLAAGLISELWWSPQHPFRSSLTGESAKDLCDAWTKDTGTQWTMPLGFTYAGFEIALNALARAGSLKKNSIREAIENTDLMTVVGPIRYDKKHCSETPLVGGQWAKGKKWPWELGICYNKTYPSIPKTTATVFPLPKQR